MTTVPDYVALPRDMTTDQMADAIEAVLRCSPDGLPQAALLKWLDMVGDAAVSLAFVSLVEQRRVAVRWDEHRQDLVMSRPAVDIVADVRRILADEMSR